MRIFLRNTALFSVLIVGISFLLAEVEFNDEFIIYKTKDTDYKKVGWNLNVIKNHPDRIKNSRVFFGSSYILNGLNDSILNVNGEKAINLAIKHSGGELNLFFLNKIIKLGPKEIIYLKGKSGYADMHKLTPLLLKPSDLILNGQSYNSYFLRYLFKRTKLSIEHIIFKYSNTNRQYTYSKSKYGIRYELSTMNEEAFSNENEIQRLRRINYSFNLKNNEFLYPDETGNKDLFTRIKRLKRKITFEYYVNNDWITNCNSQDNFVKESKSICMNNKVNFAQIYMPVVSDVVTKKSVNQLYYQPLASDSETIYSLQDYSFLKNPKYWTDEHHLSKLGSVVFTERMIKLFQNK